MISISIVIPTLNESAVIQSLLEKIDVQQYSGNFDVTVVDGGSTDDTVSLARSAGAVKVIESDRGVSKQRNAGAWASKGDLLIFIDADTKPSPFFIREVAQAYSRSHFAVACPWFVPETWRPDVHLVYGTLNCLFFLSQLRYHGGAGVCIVTTRAVFDQLRGFDEALHLGEDVDFLRRAAELGRHRHLLLPLVTSARRFETQGVLQTALFYAKISPALMFGDNEKLKTYSYPPVRKRQTRESIS